MTTFKSIDPMAVYVYICIVYLIQGRIPIVKAGDIGHVNLMFCSVVPVARRTDIAATGKMASPHLVLVDTTITGIRGSPIQVLNVHWFGFPINLSPSRVPKSVKTENAP